MQGLFLVCTRVTEKNKDVFRNRAPLFIAQIDATGILRFRPGISKSMTRRPSWRWT
jgi:hypothetical protein